MALAQEKIYTEEDYYKIPEGVREYWIVNPSDCTVFVYRLGESKFENIAYSFRNRIKAGIYDDLYIDLKDFGQN